MPRLSPLYRFLTVLYAVSGFGRIFFAVLRFWMIFLFGFAVSNIPQCPPPDVSAKTAERHLNVEELKNSFDFRASSAN